MRLDSSSLRTALALYLVLFVTAAAGGQTVLLDDFEDGLDPDWAFVDSNLEFDAEGMPTGPQPWGPGIFDATGGVLNLRTMGLVPPNPDLPPGPTVFDPLNSGTLGLAWTPSVVDSKFSSGSLRATVRANTPADVILILRADPVTFTSYSFIGSGSYGFFGFTRNDVGGIQGRLEVVPGLAFSPGEDWIMEFGVMGDKFSMKAWKVGEPEPPAPQLTVVDSTYPTGGLGIAANFYTNKIQVPTRVDATFDDILFTPLEAPSPSAIKVVSPGQYAQREGDSRNNYPTQPHRYQQVFPASDFSILDGPYEIIEIAMRPDAAGAPPDYIQEDMQASLSITSRGPGNLSSVFQQNIESDPMVVFSGSVAWTSANLGPPGGPKEFDMALHLQTSFVYDPRAGNLLLEVVSRSGSNVAAYNDGFNDPDVGILAMGDPDAVSGKGGGGAVFQFTLVPSRSRFRRGDCNGEGTVTIADAVFTLGSLFSGGEDPGCRDACDSNDDGAVNIADAILTLGVLFLTQGDIPPPGIERCGIDPTGDAVDCRRYGECP